ncbi:MAG: cyclic pyranopterin monophosphate synthase MoaC [Phycisphaerae bacterium]
MAAKRILSHISRRGQARMVDVSAKVATRRTAVAEAWVDVGPAIARRLRATGGVAKGNVLQTARLAGIMAAKRTPELIPMCHPLALESVEVEASLVGRRVRIVAAVSCEGKTGVEMEAIFSAAVAALTVYDMVKSAGKGVEIGPVRLLEKAGGKSGTWSREGKAKREEEREKTENGEG